MSDRPLTKSSHAESPKQPTVKEESSSTQPANFPRWSDASRWPAYLALALAVIAVALAGLAYFFPAHKGASVAQQGGDAKANVCSAYTATRKAVVINTNLRTRNPDDQVADLSAATSARLSLIGGGGYLRQRLAANTAAPADLTNAVNSMADTSQQLGINYLTNAPSEVQDPLRNNLNSEMAQIDKLCK
jgi:hypothetical protein